MSEQGAEFDAAREVYEAARTELFDLIDHPDYAVPVSEYRAQLRAAKLAHDRAHKAMMAAWPTRPVSLFP